MRARRACVRASINARTSSVTSRPPVTRNLSLIRPRSCAGGLVQKRFSIQSSEPAYERAKPCFPLAAASAALLFFCQAAILLSGMQMIPAITIQPPAKMNGIVKSPVDSFTAAGNGDIGVGVYRYVMHTTIYSYIGLYNNRKVY